ADPIFFFGIGLERRLQLLEISGQIGVALGAEEAAERRAVDPFERIPVGVDPVTTHERELRGQRRRRDLGDLGLALDARATGLLGRRRLVRVVVRAAAAGRGQAAYCEAGDQSRTRIFEHGAFLDRPRPAAIARSRSSNTAWWRRGAARRRRRGPPPTRSRSPSPPTAPTTPRPPTPAAGRRSITTRIRSTTSTSSSTCRPTARPPATCTSSG